LINLQALAIQQAFLNAISVNTQSINSCLSLYLVRVIGERGIELDELNQSSAVSLSYLVRVIGEGGIELHELNQSTAVSLSLYLVRVIGEGGIELELNQSTAVSLSTWCE
jgi:hypothetical protein